MNSTTLAPPPERALRLLQQSPRHELRDLTVHESETEVVLSGMVESYFLKQQAQESIRSALLGRRLINHVIVCRPVAAD